LIDVGGRKRPVSFQNHLLIMAPVAFFPKRHKHSDATLIEDSLTLWISGDWAILSVHLGAHDSDEVSCGHTPFDAMFSIDPHFIGRLDLFLRIGFGMLPATVDPPTVSPIIHTCFEHH
jgi:hypothetical protein